MSADGPKMRRWVSKQETCIGIPYSVLRQRTPTIQQVVSCGYVEPFWDVERAARFLGIGKSLAYDLIREDEFPVPVLRLGTRIKVPTKGLDEGLYQRPAPGRSPQ